MNVILRNRYSRSDIKVTLLNNVSITPYETIINGICLQNSLPGGSVSSRYCY